MNTALVALSLATAGIGFVSAQSGDIGDFPPNAQAGRCYAKCFIPDRYETYTERVLSQEAGKRLELVPGSYETSSERVMVKESYKRLEVVPATFESSTERVMIAEPSKRLELVPAVYDEETETVEIAPATTRWVRGRANPNCVSANPDDCRVWCLENVPAQVKTIRRRVMKSPPTTREIEIPAQYKVITKTVLKTPATTREVEVPAQYDTITRRTVKSAPTYREIDIPEQYSTITKTRLVDKGGFMSWQEVVCDKDLTGSRVRRIQDALRSRGFDPGPSDDVFGAKTRAALHKFQEANNLPVGGLDAKTLEALGVN